MPAVLYGHACNETYLVALVFANMEEAQAAVREIIGEPTKVKEDGTEFYRCLREDDGTEDTVFYFVTKELHDACGAEGADQGKIIEELGDAAFNKVPSKKLFTRYYGGCGELGHLLLKDVPSGKPFLPWDLD